MRRAMVAVTALAAACSDPRVDVELAFPPQSATATTAMADDVVRFDLTVAVLSGKTCDDLRNRRVTAEELALGRRTSAVGVRVGAGFAPVDLSDVPRLGAKLFVFTGYDSDGAVIAGGCQDVPAIEADTLVTIAVEPALITRIIPSLLLSPSLILPVPASETTQVQMVARERRKGGGLVDSAVLRSYLRTIERGEEPYGQVTDMGEAGSGIFTITDLGADPGAVGPVELVVRGAWSDQVNRIAAARPPTLVQAAALGAPGVPSEIAPSWVVVDTAVGTTGAPRHLVAAALYRTGGETSVVVLRENSQNRFAAPISVLAPEVRTMVAYRRDGQEGTKPEIVARIARGWVRLDWTADPPVGRATSSETTTAADQLLAFPPCGGPSIGLLAAVGTTVTGYVDNTGTTTPAAAPVAIIAGAINDLAAGGATIELMRPVCMALGAGALGPVAAVRVIDGAIEQIYLVTADGPPLLTPFVGAMTAIPLGAGASLVASVYTASGPRVQSYRLKIDDLGARLVPDGAIDHPVPGVPRALAAMQANDDTFFDTMAIEDLVGQLGLSMTLGAATSDGALSAMTIVETRGADQGLLPIGLLEGTNRQELLVTGSNGLGVYDFTPP